MDKSKIDRSMYQKAKVEASEKEHIAAPASTMLADAWIRLKKNKAAATRRLKMAYWEVSQTL